MPLNPHDQADYWGIPYPCINLPIPVITGSKKWTEESAPLMGELLGSSVTCIDKVMLPWDGAMTFVVPTRMSSHS